MLNESNNHFHSQKLIKQPASSFTKSIANKTHKTYEINSYIDYFSKSSGTKFVRLFFQH